MKTAPINVLYFSNSLARGGAEEHVLTLLRGLDRGLFQPHIVCTPAVAEMLRPDLPRDVEAIPLCLRRPGDLRAGRRLVKILSERRVDILHSHLFYSSLFASPVGWWCRVPVIVETPHIREAWRHGWLKGRFVVDRLVGRFVDHYIAVSESNARYLTQEKRLPARKVVVIQNGCDLTRFDPSRVVPAGVKRSLGFGVDDPVLVVIARLERQKGHRVLLEALPAVHRQFERARVVCVGDGALRGELEREVANLGLAGSVRFVGYQSDVTDWLALADVVVLPSFFEGLPLVTIEALAAARPVVATAVDGTPEVVVDGKTGLTVPPGDSTRLAGAICRLLGNGELRRALGRAGRRWVEAHFSAERQIQRTQEFYLAACGRHRRQMLGPRACRLSPEPLPPLHDRRQVLRDGQAR